MPLDPIVRPAGTADLEAIAGIYGHYVTSSVATFEENVPTLEAWRGRLDELSTRGLPFLVATLGDERIGYAYASPWRPKPAYRYTVEDSVYVAPQWTGHGVGRALLEVLLAECGRAGMRSVVAVIADTSSDASLILHARLGFTHAGRLEAVGRKHGRWIDTVFMQKTL